MVRICTLLLILIIFYNVFSDDIIFPTENNIITGGFGEFRWNHFHTGLDISTDGVEGKKIFSPSNCYVSYVKRDFYGYGNLIFLEDEKYIYVFAHLKNFVTKIDTILSKNKFRQAIYLPKNTLKFKKGELIGYTGSSGGVVPHLHFEVRKKDNTCINPLKLYHIEDTIKPWIEGVLFEPADDTTLINGVYDNYYITKKNGHQIESLKVNIFGKFFISAKVFDRINSISSKIFVYKINIKSNGKIISTIYFDSLKFGYNKTSPLHFRTDLKVSDANYLIKLYDMIKTPLASVERETLYSNSDTNIVIEIFDFYGNSKSVKISVFNEKNIKKRYEDRITLKKVNRKLTLTTSGIYSNYNLNDPFDDFFESYEVDKGYRYHILKKGCNIESKNIVDGIPTDKNIVLIESTKILNLDDSVFIKPYSDLYFLYDTKDFHHREFFPLSKKYDFDLCEDMLESGIKIYLNGFGGYSFYNVKGRDISFVKNLNSRDSLFVYKLSDFVIGKDTIKPKSFLLKKYNSGGERCYHYKIIDQGSGVDWFFVTDSNDFYVEPVIGKSKVIIKLHNGDSNKLFIVKDKEGNRDTLFLY
ncbi:MAG: M23 family metallopeptidase [bacterium]|uniref:Peptidase M23 family n=2 Tax=Bacteria candidate phyla TaxID=1783234 RepID=A0A117M6P5_UNCT6|nr:MAG: Peptidase M23 family [candidate division TA06 bacterium 32_111]KUK87352.1 MAG: Peptidase M23 family [candidate division TA06 bacterium 34_109]MDI6701194.1 M23 family metallopeptidase [bacterium]HAF07815.1 hypothetical protein [candidate division WOR-3 bacterium]HCP17333.1 hypothetical protein [candidate division WOR-3 bacterium]